MKSKKVLILTTCIVLIILSFITGVSKVLILNFDSSEIVYTNYKSVSLLKELISSFNDNKYQRVDTIAEYISSEYSGDERAMYLSKHYMALVYFDKGNYDQSLEYLYEIEQNYKDVMDDKDCADFYYLIAKNYYELQQYTGSNHADEIQNNMIKSIQYREAYGFGDDEIYAVEQSFTELFTSYLFSQRYDKMNESIEYAKRLLSKSDVIDLYEIVLSDETNDKKRAKQVIERMRRSYEPEEFHLFVAEMEYALIIEMYEKVDELLDFQKRYVKYEESYETDYSYNYNLARYYEGTGDIEKAINYYKRAADNNIYNVLVYPLVDDFKRLDIDTSEYEILLQEEYEKNRSFKFK